jgi:hypothetical protein
MKEATLGFRKRDNTSMRNVWSTVTSIGWNGIAMVDERINALEKSPCVSWLLTNTAQHSIFMRYI